MSELEVVVNTDKKHTLTVADTKPGDVFTLADYRFGKEVYLRVPDCYDKSMTVLELTANSARHVFSFNTQLPIALAKSAKLDITF